MPSIRVVSLASAVAMAVSGVVAAGGAARSQESGRLAVFAAASLTEAFPALNPQPRYSFAGSDQLATQIQLGASVDVFAAASPKYPELLFQKGLVEKPIPFATNTLVLIVPKSNPAGIRSVADLTKPGVRIVVGAPAVPVGAYTQIVLKNLGIGDQVGANVVSRETDVKGVVGKVALGEADAGFVYVTDARPVRGKVLAIAIRESAQPHVVYEVAVLKNARHPVAAHRFVTQLIRKPAQDTLVRYGFGRRPKSGG
jgi:molybdate transport system substrate-binding protein